MVDTGSVGRGIDLLSQRLRAEMVTDPVTEDRVRAIVAQMGPDGSWPDIDYADRARTHWSPAQHTLRTALLARAYRQPGHPMSGEPALERAVLSALSAWTERDPESDNWWFNCIHTPRHLGQVLLLMGRAVPRPDWERAVSIVRRSSLQRTGANLTWEAGNLLVLACAIRDEALLCQAAEALTREIRITTDEGIQPDFSFHQHGPQLYMSNYGEVFSAENSRYAVLFAGTSFALGHAQIEALSGLVREGQQWFLWGRQFDYHAMGRQIDSPGATYRGSGFAAICDRMAQVDPAHAHEYADMSQRVTGAQGPGESGPRGNRHFWRSDVMVHRPGAFYASVRMHSTRTSATEVRVNRENLKGYHLSDGVCFVMQRGDEYHEIQPVWDWRKLPGATCRDTDDPLPYGREVRSRGNTAFVGGASDGRTGVAAMDYERDGVRARKAWFYSDEGWMCLGAGITCDGSDPVTTSVNQCNLRSEVVLLRGGQAQPLASRGLEAEDLQGVYHDGIGYYFPEPQRAVVRAGQQSGTWTSIEEKSPHREVVTKDVFSLWIEHGPGPRDARYAYRVVPGLDRDGFPAHARGSPVCILSNEARLQAISHSTQEIVQAVFYGAGCLDVGDGRSLCVDAPCILILRPNKDGLTIAVSEPTQCLERIGLQLAGRFAGEDCAYWPKEKVTAVPVALPKGPYAGQTVVRTLTGPGLRMWRYAEA
ncbi:MAG: polysaccharide lyase 8 family protein [Anaerolineae bacterium]|nr:polysaccharide lyase 8 family protein [Anaerolineae bacterium]